MKTAIISIIVAVLLAIALLQIDDELNPEVAIWLDELNRPKSSEAYYYLMGIFAAEDEQPREVGLQIFKSIQEAEEKYLVDRESFDFTDYPEEKKISTPAGELYCKIWEKGCFKSIFELVDNIQTELLENSALLERYQIFLEFDEYATLSKSLEVMPFTSYSHLVSGHRLNNLKTVKMASDGKAVKAIDNLMKDIENLRDKIQYTDEIIGKMIFLLMLSEDIDLLSVLSNKHQLQNIPDLNLLNEKEINFESSIIREFGWQADLFQDLDRNPEIFKEGGTTPDWYVRMVYKPNMTMNSVYPYYKQMITASQMKQKEFNSYINNRNINRESDFRLRNYVGSVLTNIGKPDLMKYISRLYDINCKIVLFNNRKKWIENFEDISTIENPYGIGDKPLISKDKNKICFDGPLEDDRNLRCLALKL